ncbi:MAG: hypothetical protein JKY48_17380, partial [Flavobacteriales bacterium]|nr:hypothetical protein [Flavobacteriales bacterium]
MNRLLLFFFLLLICSHSVLAQRSFNSSASFSWKSDSTINFKIRSTNFAKEQLANFKIVNNSPTYQHFSYQYDSVYIAKGISIYSKTFTLQDLSIDAYTDTLKLQIKVSSVSSKKVISSSEFILNPRVTKWSVIHISDSTLSIMPSPKSVISYTINSSPINDSLDQPIHFTSKADTILSWNELILHSPFQERELEIIQKDTEGKEKKLVFHYKDGRLISVKPSINSTKDTSLIDEEKKAIKLNGTIGIESNFFSQVPQHSNGSQYPYTSFQASNTISVYGLPFTLNASHSTNKNISPNFRNFFSFQFDVASYREQIQQLLSDKELSKVYSLNDVLKDIETNNKAINNLEKTKDILINYPNESVDLDSILSDELNQIDISQKTDSLFQLDSLAFDSSAGNDLATQRSHLNAGYTQLDSGITENQEKIQRIQKNIDRLKRSNEFKEKYLNELKTNPPSIPKKPIAAKSLFSEFEGNNFISTLLRFEKFELGNFYEYAGQYSIRDIEMRGINTSFLLNDENTIKLLYGKVNNFQSLNLDHIKDNKKVTSFSIGNTHFDFFQASARVTQFKDETINTELTENKASYYIMSLNAEGDISDFVSYAIEVNQSNDKLK